MISKKLAEDVSVEIEKFTAKLERAEIINKSLDNYGYALWAGSIERQVLRILRKYSIR